MRAQHLARLAVLASAVACHLPYSGGAKPVQPSALDAGWLRAAPTPVVVQQREDNCGLAAPATIASAWGRHWTEDDLVMRLHPGPGGVKLGALRDLARDRGLVAFAVRATYEDLQHELSSGRPVVLGLVLPFDREHNKNHYEVAVAMNPRDGSIVTIDPASGSWMQRSRKVLDLEWKTGGYAALVVIADKGRDGTHDAPTPVATD